MDLDQIDSELKSLDQQRNTLRQGEFFMQVMLDTPTIDLAWIESRLRLLDCPLLFLLAIPEELIQPGLHIFDPLNRFVPKFWVWHCVNGRDERTKAVQYFRLPANDAVNLENLKVTGFLGVGAQSP